MSGRRAKAARRVARLQGGLRPSHQAFPLTCCVCGARTALQGHYPATQVQADHLSLWLGGVMEQAGWSSSIADDGTAVAVCPACSDEGPGGFLDPTIYPYCLAPHADGLCFEPLNLRPAAGRDVPGGAP